MAEIYPAMAEINPARPLPPAPPLPPRPDLPSPAEDRLFVKTMAPAPPLPRPPLPPAPDFPFPPPVFPSPAEDRLVVKMLAESYSSPPAAAGDHPRLFVKCCQCDSRKYGHGDLYLCDISFSPYRENLYLPCFGGDGGCCRGFLYLHHMDGRIVILNPIRREFKFLPASKVQRPKLTNYSLHTACGLGFDSQSNDYKLVRSVSNYFHEYYNANGSPGFTHVLDRQIELYSLKTNTWKVIDSPPHKLLLGSGVYVNNTSKCYWVQHSPFESVIAFDFEKETLSSCIRMPPSFITSSDLDCDDPDVFDGMNIFEYKGSLAVIGYKKSGFHTLYEAWILKEEEQDWEQEFSIEVFGDHKPLGFGKNGRSLFLERNYVEDKSYQLLEFDLIDRYLKQLPIYVESRRCMQILSCSYDEPDTVVLPVLPGAKQFWQVPTDSSEQWQGLDSRRGAVGPSWMTNEEGACSIALNELTAQGCKSDNGCEAGHVSKLEDGLKKKNSVADRGTDHEGIQHVISIFSTWKPYYYYSQSQGLSGS